MGGESSKIPSPYPGQLLKLTGIVEFDEVYEELEESIKEIEYCRIEIDLRFTDYIYSLGAPKLWERCSDFKETLRMMLVVLATNKKGNINSIRYEPSPPYLHFVLAEYSYSIKALVDNFKSYVTTVHEISQELKNMETKFDEIDLNQKLEDIHNELLNKTVENHYCTKDMISVAQIANSNNKLISKSVESLKKIFELGHTIKNEISDVFRESRKSPRLDKIIQQASQAMFEGLGTPEAIVKYFWPYPVD